MDIERAKELISVLADGVDPLTGEVLEDDHLCNKPEIIRAMHVVLEELKKRPKKRPENLPENAGKPWTKDDDEELCRMFDDGMDREFICDHFKRTPGGIASRLVRLGKIKERDEFWKRQG